MINSLVDCTNDPDSPDATVEVGIPRHLHDSIFEFAGKKLQLRQQSLILEQQLRQLQTLSPHDRLFVVERPPDVLEVGIVHEAIRIDRHPLAQFLETRFPNGLKNTKTNTILQREQKTFK